MTSLSMNVSPSTSLLRKSKLQQCIQTTD